MSKKKSTKGTNEEVNQELNQEVNQELKQEIEQVFGSSLEKEEAPLTPILIPLINESGLERPKAQVVLENFTAFFNQAAEWERQVKSIVITDAGQKREMKMAREARLALKEIRTNAEKVKKKLKENILIEGRFIDGIYNSVVAVTKPLEEELLEKEKFAEIQEERRKEEIRLLRYNALAPYELDPNYYDLVNMPDEEFNQLLINSKKVYEESVLARQREEEERILKEQEAELQRKRLEEENARLRKEAMEREMAERRKNERINALFQMGFQFNSNNKQYFFENIVVNFEQVVNDSPADFKKMIAGIEVQVNNIKEVKRQQEIKIQQERTRQEREEWLRNEEVRLKNEAQERIMKQAEQHRLEMEEAERKRLADEEFRAMLAPDKDKLKQLISTFNAIKLPDVTTPEAKKIANEVRILVGRLTNHISESIRKLP